MMNLQEIERRRYYEGFGVGREKKMFEEELKDVETTYNIALKAIDVDLDNLSPHLLFYMGEYIKLNGQRAYIRDKLDTLLEKMGKKSESENKGEHNE